MKREEPLCRASKPTSHNMDAIFLRFLFYQINPAAPSPVQLLYFYLLNPKLPRVPFRDIAAFNFSLYRLWYSKMSEFFKYQKKNDYKLCNLPRKVYTAHKKHKDAFFSLQG